MCRELKLKGMNAIDKYNNENDRKQNDLRYVKLTSNNSA